MLSEVLRLKEEKRLKKIAKERMQEEEFEITFKMDKSRGPMTNKQLSKVSRKLSRSVYGGTPKGSQDSILVAEPDEEYNQRVCMQRMATNVGKSLLFRGLTSVNTSTNRAVSKVDLPSRLPSFERLTALNNHAFDIGKDSYEYIDGQYFKKVRTLTEKDYFGEMALQRSYR